MDVPQAENIQSSIDNVNGIAMIMVMFVLMVLHTTALGLLLFAPQVPANLSVPNSSPVTIFCRQCGNIPGKIEPQPSQA